MLTMQLYWKFVAFFYLYLSSTIVLCKPQISLDDSNFDKEYPVTIIQNKESNAVSIVDTGNNLDSDVNQTGFYNRAAIIQFGVNRNESILLQQGRYNRAMVVQIGADNISNSNQTGPNSVNYQFTMQTSANDDNPIAQQFSILTLDEAKSVANNFIYAPETARVNVGLLEDITLHFNSVIDNRLMQNHNRLLNGLQKTHKQNCGTEKTFIDKADCSSTSLFGIISYGETHRDSSMGVLGYEQKIRSATIGLDFISSQINKLGFALNVEKSDGDVKEGMGKVDTTGYQIGLFGSFSHSQYYLDLIATLGKVNFTSERFSEMTTSVHSDVDGIGYTGYLHTGYFFNHNNFTLGPLLSMTYSKGTVDSYWETGNVLLTQWIEKQDRERFVASVGATLDHQSYINNFSFNSNLKFELERDFGIGAKNETYSRFSFSESTVFTPIDDVSASNYGKISIGFNLEISKQIQFLLGGMMLIGADRIDRKNIYGGLLAHF